MKRREFGKAATAVAAVTLTGVGCGGSGGDSTAAASDAAPAPAPVPAPPASPGSWAIGTNLGGMQWADMGLRFGASTLPNVHFTVPRRADVAWLAANGYSMTRLPIQWELLQPMLHDTVASAAVRAAIGNPGEFHAGYESFITGLLDAHATAGMKCVIDLHNYCRYVDFKYQPNGSVIGFVVPDNPLVRPYTTDPGQVQERIFALAPGAMLKQSNFNDFWTRAARKWKDHPGFGGYNLMNEPFNMPEAGQTVESNGVDQDFTIWPAYAQSAINAIRAVDPVNPIYLGGNNWSAAMSIANSNPGFPLSGANLIYEVHMYLDAGSTGQGFDYQHEVSRNFSAGFSGPQQIHVNTGVDRLKIAVDWAQQHGVRLALTETGMPVDDPRWQEMFQRLVDYARSVNVEVFTWNGGNHWPLHNAGINNVPGWHQNKTLEPVMSSVMKSAAGIAHAAVFDDGAGWAPPGTPVTITVYSRGSLAAPLGLTVSSNNGGSLSKTTLTLAAGANAQDSFTFTPGANRVTTLSYASSSAAVAPPPPRKVYSLSDPVAYAATSLHDAAMAIIAKYSACKWEMADGYTDYMLGAPAAAGQVVRAIADSGYGSSVGNAMEMLNWTNKDNAAMGSMSLPVMRVVNGRKATDHSGNDIYGFWCRKTFAVPNRQPNPRNVVPYGAQDAHFVIAATSVPAATSGLLFQASNSEGPQSSDLAFSNGRPQANWLDTHGQAVLLTSPAPLPANTPAVIGFASAPGAQVLRVNSSVVASAGATLNPSVYDQLLIGWGFQSHYPRAGFGGNVYAVVTGKGAPTANELAVLERYVASTAGI